MFGTIGSPPPTTSLRCSRSSVTALPTRTLSPHRCRDLMADAEFLPWPRRARTALYQWFGEKCVDQVGKAVGEYLRAKQTLAAILLVVILVALVSSVRRGTSNRACCSTGCWRPADWLSSTGL